MDEKGGPHVCLDLGFDKHRRGFIFHDRLGM